MTILDYKIFGIRHFHFKYYYLAIKLNQNKEMPEDLKIPVTHSIPVIHYLYW